MKDAIARVAKRKGGLSTLAPVTPETKPGQGGKQGFVILSAFQSKVVMFYVIACPIFLFVCLHPATSIPISVKK